MTLLFHVDESRDSAHHFHVGLLTNGPTTAAVEAAMRSIVEQAAVDGACAWEAEVHGVEVFHGNAKWARGSIAQRVAVFDQVLGLLTTHGVEVIARGANLSRFTSNYGPENDPYVWEFSNLLERLNERCYARDDFSLVIADEQSEHKETLRRQLAHAKQFGTGGYRSQKLERVLDTAHFVDSRLSRMTQVADMVAFVMRRRAGRRVERDPRLEAVMERWSNLIYAAIPEPAGQYYTVR
jgi:hypothetical protein